MEPKLKWMVIIMLALVNDWYCCYGCREQDRIALLQLKAHINHPNGTSLPYWVENKEDVDCCNWLRVICNTKTRRVAQLDLSFLRDPNLGDWYFNASTLLQFEKLIKLDLNGNQMVGWVENEGFERISSRLRNLMFLYLNDNHLNNSIVSSLNGLSSLRSLHIGWNRLKGSIQIEELDAFSNLEELDISENSISKFMVSKGTKSLSKLQVLHLDGCVTNASIILQSSLEAFSSLRTLYFTSAKSEEINITHVLHGSSNLEDLILDYSSLNNNFLQYIGGLTSLKVLSLKRCGLNGTLSAQGLCKLENLEELSLSGNDFVGPLPSCLGNLKSLRLLDVSYNQFTGNIAFSPLINLRLLDVSYNQFTGNIALSPLINLTSLEYLSISSNRLLQVPISFKSFANNSNLKVILSDNNNLIAETTFQTWAPKFQLKVFSLSNCTFEGLDVGLTNFLNYQYDLRVVDLSHNSFKGTFPAWLHHNTRLEGLFMSNTSFMGLFRWPSRSYPSISVIDISNNNLQGQIPKNMSSMFPNLRALNMSRNMLTGEIPSYIGNLSSLNALDLSENHLSGVFPKELAIGCSKLYFLKLSNNKLHGQLFPSSTTLSKLGFLLLDGNGFEGSIPESLSNTSISALDIGNNNISGKLPRWMGNYSFIYEVAMYNNHLEGAIPTEFCKVYGLVSLDLSENHLSGSIPSSCFSWPSLAQVYLDNNNLSGPMTHAFENSSSLVTLNLRYNNFSGRIPDWIGSLSSLTFLLLKGNNFEGGIPYNICQLNQLNILDLSHNHLTGPIPSCLGNLTYKASLYKEATFFPGYSTASIALSYVERTQLMPDQYLGDYLPYLAVSVQEVVEFRTKRISYLFEGDILKKMSGIDLSCNQLSGKIPLEIGDLSNIRALNLSYNNLTGPIPATFSNLKKIESLDLSNNNLNGRIPPQLVDMTFMGTFSVAHNNLSGPTPDRKFQFGTFEENSYEGNPLLCGPPLNNSCNENELTTPMPFPMEGEGEDGSFIDPIVFQLSFVVSYVAVLLGIVAVLYINPYWRHVWFYFIEVCIEFCYYFVLENLRKISNIINMWFCVYF